MGSHLVLQRSWLCVCVFVCVSGLECKLFSLTDTASTAPPRQATSLCLSLPISIMGDSRNNSAGPMGFGEVQRRCMKSSEHSPWRMAAAPQVAISHSYAITSKQA